jgi:hypothetical protein
VVSLTYENPDTKTGWVEAAVVAGTSGVAPAKGDELEFSYISYLDDSQTDTLMYKQTLYYSSERVRVNTTPFKYTTGIANNTRSAAIDLSGTYTIERIYPTIERSICPSQAGMTTSQIKLNSAVAVPIDNYYTDNTIKITSGTGAGQSRIIGAYSNYVGTLKAGQAAWAPQPDATSKYVIISNVSHTVDSARDVIDIVLNTALEGTGTLSADDQLTISYTYNKTVDDIQNDIDISENRPITTDVLSREAAPIYIYCGLQMKCKRGRGITTYEETLLSGIFQDIIDSINFNSKLEMSDIIGTLYIDSEVNQFMDYINMPVIFFSTTTQAGYTEDELFALSGADYNKTTVEFTGPRYPIVGMFAVRAIN